MGKCNSRKEAGSKFLPLLIPSILLNGIALGVTQIACHRCGGWDTGGPPVAATGVGGPLVAHPRCAIWEMIHDTALLKGYSVLESIAKVQYPTSGK